ncbi:MAG: winged helix-turn-helix transcriptional regulator [Catenulispora sp.]|nr:winged helix-turn-helix transcriptional regulator [Catenulispora sp.]
MPGTRLLVTSLVSQVGRGIRTTLDQRFGDLGLTSQQAGVLLHISGGTTSPRQLAGLVGTDTAGMTRLLDRLANKKYIRRRPGAGDRRAITVELTAAGRKLLPRLMPIFDGVADAITADISPTELTVVLRALESMQTKLDTP